MVNVPPLLCSTPPPIDFGEDEDDSGLQTTLNLEEEDDAYNTDFQRNVTTPDLKENKAALTKGNNNVEYNEILPPPDVNNFYLSRVSPPPINYNVDGDKTIASPREMRAFETFNFDETYNEEKNGNKEAILSNKPKINLDDGDDMLQTNCYEHEIVSNDNDVPSLKLDSLSLYSSESVSSGTMLSPEHSRAENKETYNPKMANELSQTKAVASQVGHVLTSQVTLEDVSDDSSDEYAASKCNNLIIPENAENFFAIEIIAGQQKSSDKNFESPTETVTINDKIDENSDYIENFASFHTTNSQDLSNSATMLPAAKVKVDDFDTIPVEFPAGELTKQIDPTIMESNVIEDDDFDDFQDFVSTPDSQIPVNVEQQKISGNESKAAPINQYKTDIKSDKIDDSEGSEDDFGEFSVASPLQETPALIPKSNTSISDQIKSVLNMVFPTPVAISTAANNEISTYEAIAISKKITFTAIEQAKALDYQWSNSEMRHALIKSLGIDSRNILFGDKWNASMPRFAANLSFDPLQPLKTQEVVTTTATVKATTFSNDSGWNSCVNTSTHEGSIATANIQSKTGENIAANDESQLGTIHGATNGQEKEQAAGNTTSKISSIVDNTRSDTIQDYVSNDTTTTTSTFVAFGSTKPLSFPLSTNSSGNSIDSMEKQNQQQHIDLKPHTTTAMPFDAEGAVEISAKKKITLLDENNVLAPIQQIETEVVVGNSFVVPMKETHIYTPSKSDTAVAKTTTIKSKASPIDFDYEIASAGIIIDETVVKKEYRDVEYKLPSPPIPFDLETTKPIVVPAPICKDTNSILDQCHSNKFDNDDDDFSDFQSVPPTTTAQCLGTSTFGNQMILSPAILLPKSIPLSKTTIEWGNNSACSIDPEELARIEELFSKPKKMASNATVKQVNSVQSSSPTVARTKTPTISATLAQQQENESDDDWSDFVSVPVLPTPNNINSNNNNNNMNNKSTPLKKPHANVSNATQRSKAIKSHVKTSDDEWSDFVSVPAPAPTSQIQAQSQSAPQPQSQPQFNSAAWQSANFYNNPLSLYQQQQQRQHPTHSDLVQNIASKSNNNPNVRNNNSHYNNNNSNQTNGNNGSQQQHQIPQQIHIMHDFSTAPPLSTQPARGTVPPVYQQHLHNHLHKGGNAKIAPSISLIPDLSFAAPAVPTNARSFINSLSKPSFSAKK